MPDVNKRTFFGQCVHKVRYHIDMGYRIPLELAAIERRREEEAEIWRKNSKIVRIMGRATRVALSSEEQG